MPAKRLSMRQVREVLRLKWACGSHSAPFFAVLTQFWQRLLKRGENERYTDHYICSNRLFPWPVFLNHNFHKLRDPHFWPFGVSRRDSAFPPDERPMIIPPRPAKV